MKLLIHGLEGSLDWLNFNVSTIRHGSSSSTEILVLLHRVGGESPVSGDNNFLSTGELVLATTETFYGIGKHVGASANRHENLVDMNTGDTSVSFSVSVTHTGLETKQLERKINARKNEPIGTSARKHFVNAENMERMDANANVERFTTSSLGKVLVSADTSSLKRLRGNLFQLTVNSHRKV